MNEFRALESFVQSYTRDYKGEVAIARDVVEQGYVLSYWNGKKRASLKLRLDNLVTNPTKAWETVAGAIKHVIWLGELEYGVVAGVCGKWRKYNRRTCKC